MLLNCHSAKPRKDLRVTVLRWIAIGRNTICCVAKADNALEDEANKG